MNMVDSGKVGLHLHSCFSDGHDKPEILAQKLKDAGAKVGMIADHDTVRGVGKFVQSCNELGIIPIPGVEITTKCETFNGNYELHLLGFNINHELSGAEELFKGSWSERKIRSLGSIRRLKQEGILKTSFEELVHICGSCGQYPSLLHVMDHLIRREGMDFEIARKAVLDAEANGSGKDCFLILSWQEGVAAIEKLQGISILAHPGGLEKQFDGSPQRKLEKLVKCIEKLSQGGLQGLEVFHPKHTWEQEERYSIIAEAFDLVVVSGSDYHGRHVLRKNITHHGVSVTEVLNLLGKC